MAMLTGSRLSFAVFSNRIISPPVTTAADHWSLYQGLRNDDMSHAAGGGLRRESVVRWSWDLWLDDDRHAFASDADEVVVS